MTCVLVIRGALYRGTDTHTGEKLREDESRDQGEVSTSQGRTNVARKPSRARRRAWNRFPLRVLRGN